MSRGILPCLLVVGFACQSQATADASADGVDLSKPHARVAKADGQSLLLQLEVANTPAKRQLGLMYRKTMPPNHGMVFVFPKPARQSFWMKNTFIPLDLIFLDHNRFVVGSYLGAKPHDLRGVGVDEESLYVVEVNAGYVARHNIQRGDRFHFAHIDPVAVR